MRKNKKLSEDEVTNKKDLFIKTIDVLYSNITEEKKFSRVILEALLYGVGKNLEKSSSMSNEYFNSLCQEILDSTAFQSSELQGGLMHQSKVKARLNIADEIFRR